MYYVIYYNDSQDWTAYRVASIASTWRTCSLSCVWPFQSAWAPSCPTCPCWWIPWCPPSMAPRHWSVKDSVPWSCAWTTSSQTSCTTTYSRSGPNSCRSVAFFPPWGCYNFLKINPHNSPLGLNVHFFPVPFKKRFSVIHNLSTGRCKIKTPY